MSLTSFVVLVFVSLACSRYFVRIATPSARLLYGVYALSYLVTTVIGAIILGFSSDSLWNLLNFGVDTSALKEPGVAYWFLLFAPFVVVPAVILLFRPQRTYRLKLTSRPATNISLVVFAFVSVSFASYCFVRLHQLGALSNILGSLKPQEYQDFITSRSELLSAARTPFYGVIYMSLPALSSIALFQMIQTRQLRWRVAFLSTAAMTSVLSLSTMLKGPLFLFAGVTLLGFYLLGRLSLSKIIMSSVAAFAIFTVWQGLFFSAWTALGSLYMFFFRMAHAYPFYAGLFPRTIPYIGSNYGLALLGFGGGNNDNLLVFDQMYPDITFVQGSVAAPAHLRAYAQAGWPNLIWSLILIGVIFAAFASVRRWRESPFRFAVFVQGLLISYYLTQVGVRSVLVESFSIVFGLIAIISVWGLDAIFRLATQNVRLRILKEGLGN